MVTIDPHQEFIYMANESIRNEREGYGWKRLEKDQDRQGSLDIQVPISGQAEVNAKQ
jgi:hypothetical protein